MADEGVGTLWYSVEARTGNLIAAEQAASKSMDNFTQNFKRAGSAADSFNPKLTQTSASVQGLGRSMESTSSQALRLTKLLGGLIAVQGISGLVQMAEGYNEMAERIRMATSSVEEYELVQQRLLATANGTYRSMEEAQESYIRTADSLRSMGYSTEQVLDITDSLSYSFVKNAASGQRAEAALSAYTKAINTGKVDAQGWQSILAAIPSVIDDIAKSSGRSATEIRELGASGKLVASDLNEGLRKSLDANKEAADDMATTIADAFKNMRNNLTVYVGEANRASGATSLMSAAIVKFGENIDTVVKLLLLAGSGALAKYIAQLGASVIASGRAILAARAQAAEELKLAQAHVASTAAALAHANANVGLTGTTAAATAAARAHSIALVGVAAASRTAATAGATLMGVLGGPAGIIALIATAATGILLFGNNASTAAGQVDGLADSIDTLGKAQLQLRKQQASEAIIKLEDDAREAGGAVQALEKDLKALQERSSQGRGVDAAGLANVNKTLIEQRANQEKANEALERARVIQGQINEEIEKRDSAAKASPNLVTKADPEVEKRLQSLRDGLELAKLEGAARARLQAIQALGTNATKEEREEAERLATQIYELENAKKGQTDATKKSIAADKENMKVLDGLATSLMQAGLSGEELAAAKASASLNKFATPEEVAMVEQLARALYQIGEAEKIRAKIGKTKAEKDKYFGSDVAPLSGGAFDDQFARYEQEAQAEQKRYDDQQQRLREALEVQEITYEEFYERELGAAQTHADRMAQIEQAKNSVILSSGQELFGSLADALKNYSGEASSAYGALFAISKAFAIANAGINLSSAISQAMADPTALTPAQKFANMAAIASAGGQLVSSIAGASFGGGRQYGGPVSAGKMYRVNETGAPEILNTNGKQYLMMNQSSGSVEPLKAGGAGSGGSSSASGGVNVYITIESDGNSNVNAPAGMEQFGRDIGEMVDRRFQELTVRSYMQGGTAWQSGNGGGF